ncbi:uncharacterized protein N7518_006978 [Penicillium psychrosexuale]|uniref:uncharacterized protein n=1 Tax=Penicillium psychrosexuale TaxID=1002107 RepID=UPI002544E78E|nr:uncharacterized protein N7518_006978 [Penicillium psychrosexuale]KAJ5789967.1 hypothetical protein N7518_006978 [Penicillium psychrosexuale]
MSFPTDVAEFDSDPRISFSRPDNSFLLETKDGREFLFNTILKRWVESIDEKLIRQQQGYGPEDPESEIVHPRDRKKRKQSQEPTDEPKVKKPRVNTAVWVTNIPTDATFSEIHESFKKYGILAEELDTGKPRIVMYNDENGNFNGEALVVYFRPESVTLAIQLLDETDFRLGVPNPCGLMRVQEADFSYKREQEAEPKVLTTKEKKKLKERADRLNKKLSDWGDDEAELAAKARQAAEEARRHVVLKHMFTLEELEEDPLATIEIHEDITSECAKIGPVLKVMIWDGEADGVATVRFVSAADARRCAQSMDGRIFSKRTIVAYIWNGEEKFKKHRPRRDRKPEDSDDENERLERYGDWLESGGNKTNKNQETENEKADKDETDKSQETNNEKADKNEVEKNEVEKNEAEKNEADKSLEIDKN